MTLGTLIYEFFFTDHENDLQILVHTIEEILLRMLIFEK